MLLPGVYAQRYSFKRYDQESGLPDQSVRCLLQDRAGFLWVGTENGLFRYDGHRFRGFTTDDGLPASQIEAMHQGRDGTLWVATLPGLARLNGERFEAVDISPARGPGAIATDSAGRLYVGTFRGLIVAESAGGSQKPAFRTYTIPGAESQVVRSVAITGSGQVWYTCSRQICRLEGGRGVTQRDSGVPDDLWQSVVVDRDGSVWARSRTQLIELSAGETRFERRDADLPPAPTHAALFAAPGWPIVGAFDSRARAPYFHRMGHHWKIAGAAHQLRAMCDRGSRRLSVDRVERSRHGALAGLPVLGNVERRRGALIRDGVGHPPRSHRRTVERQ